MFVSRIVQYLMKKFFACFTTRRSLSHGVKLAFPNRSLYDSPEKIIDVTLL
jgi:hypothetical protein